MSLQSTIASGIELEFEDMSNGRWISTPYFSGKPMEPFEPNAPYCRDLYTFSVGSRRYLMKIDRDPTFLQCPNELRLWQRLDREHRRYFVPIVHGDEGRFGTPPFTVSPWVPNLVTWGWGYTCPEELYGQLEIVDAIENRYNLRDLQFNKNWYVRNGRPLIVDYGCQQGQYGCQQGQ